MPPVPGVQCAAWRILFRKPKHYTPISFWWTDWQQGEAAGGLPGGALNPTIVLNKIRSTDRKRRGGARAQERPVVMGRWGGLGNHRYQVSFYPKP